MFAFNNLPPLTATQQKKHPSVDAPGLASNGSLHMDSGRLGFVVICGTDATVLEVVSDGLGIESCLPAGADLTGVFRPFCSREAAKVVRQARPHRPVYDQELSVTGAWGALRLYCSAFAVDSRVIVIGATQPIGHIIPPELLRLVRDRPRVLAPVLDHVRKLYSDHSNLSQKSHLPVNPRRRARTRASHLQSCITAMESGDFKSNWLLELAAHDLHNPVSGVLAGLEYLKEDAAQLLDANHLVVLSAIHSSAKRALELLHHLNEISRITADNSALDLRPADLAGLVQQAASAARLQAESAGVDISVKIAKTPEVFIADALKLGEALRSLAARVLASCRPGGVMEIVAGARGREATILFRREDASASPCNAPAAGSIRKSRGAQPSFSDVHTTLVLAHARQVVKLHGGSIRTKTYGKRGYVLTVTLPMSAAEGIHAMSASAGVAS